MADIELVIKMPEEMYDWFENGFPDEDDAEKLWQIVKNATPLQSTINKIRAEIETKYGQCDICEYFENYDYEENDISEYRPIGNIADILQIIDKYKAEESEG